MKIILLKSLMLVLSMGVLCNVADAQAQPRSVKKRSSAQKTTTDNSNATVNPTLVDTATVIAPPPVNDSLPIESVKPSLRPETALDVHNG
jgi:hypothetical protein